jgi:hypothetical protein
VLGELLCGKPLPRVDEQEARCCCSVGTDVCLGRNRHDLGSEQQATRCILGGLERRYEPIEWPRCISKEDVQLWVARRRTKKDDALAQRSDDCQSNLTRRGYENVRSTQHQVGRVARKLSVGKKDQRRRAVGLVCRYIVEVLADQNQICCVKRPRSVLAFDHNQLCRRLS